MEKKFFVFLALSMLVLFLYSAYFAPKVPEKTPGKTGRSLAEPAGGKPETLAQKVPLPGAVTAGPEKRVEKREGKDVVVETDLYRMVLTTGGARIKSVRLKKYGEAKVKKEVLIKELTRVETELIKEKGRGARSKLVRQRDRLKYLIGIEPLPSDERVELVPFDGPVYGNYPLTLESPVLDKKGDLNSALYRPSREELKLDGRQKSGTIEFSYVTAAGVTIKKRFTFSRDSYLIGLEIIIENNSSREITDKNFLVVYGPDIGLIKKTQIRGRKITHFASWVQGKLVRDLAGKGIGQGFFKKTTMKWGVPKFRPGPVGWTAMRNSYFAVALIPGEKVAGAQLLERANGTRQVALKMLPFSVPRGGEVTEKLSLYLGPQDMGVLKKIGSHLAMIVDFGFWSWIARPIYALLTIFYKWFGNYGVSIILLSLTIKLIFYPFTHKSFESMKKMQDDMKALQPELNVLKEKYKNKAQKLQKATMELYKKRGVNPLGGCKGGCLPLLFQTPVFFALYAVLYNTIELRQAPFIHHWINDLSSPDPYKILPILMGGTMYLQQKLTGMGGSGGAQPEQAKMMSILMPVVLTFVFFNLPSGVVLYYIFFNVFTSLQQLLIKKKSGAKCKM